MTEREPKAPDQESEVSVGHAGEVAAESVEEMVVDSDQPSHVPHCLANDLKTPTKTQVDDHIVQIIAGKAEVRLHDCLAI